MTSRSSGALAAPTISTLTFLPASLRIAGCGLQCATDNLGAVGVIPIVHIWHDDLSGVTIVRIILGY